MQSDMVEQMQHDYKHLQTIGSVRIGSEEIQADMFVHTGNHRQQKQQPHHHFWQWKTLHQLDQSCLTYGNSTYSNGKWMKIAYS